MGRFKILREIERLDPERDHQRIMHLSFGYEFPWDSVRALEIALYRTYCIPGISALLDRTGEFHRHAQRRYDDTAILIAEMCEHGYEKGRGGDALERMNWAHGHFKIANDDFRYVLSTFVFEPVRWIDRYAWRRLCPNERDGYYWFWREVGVRMGIRDILPSYDALEAWSRDYERRQLRYADSNRRIGIATRELFVSWVPRPFARLARAGIHALLEDDMLDAFGFPKPMGAMRAATRTAVRLRGAVVRWLPPRSRPHFFTDDRNRSHPDGYDIGRLGPPRLVEAERRKETPGAS